MVVDAGVGIGEREGLFLDALFESHREYYETLFDRLDHFKEKTAGMLYAEVGCGVGLHPIKFSKMRDHDPSYHLFAWERTTEKFLKFHRRYEHHPQVSPVLTPMHGDFFSDMKVMKQKRPLLYQSLFRVLYLLYPNPYPKKGQLKNRIYGQDEHLNILQQVLCPGGWVVWRTNEMFYAEDLRSLLAEDKGEIGAYFKEQEYQQFSSNSLLLAEASLHQLGHPPFEGALTHFEKKYLQRQEICHQVIWQKR